MFYYFMCGILKVYTFPTSVDPVKDKALTLGDSQRAPPTSMTLSLEQGTTLTTPAGTPANSHI